MLFLLAYVLMTVCSPRMKEYDLTPAYICFYLYLCCHGLFGRSMILLSSIIVQIPLCVIVYLGSSNTPEVFSTQILWQTLGLIAPLVIFLCWKTYCARNTKPAPIAAGRIEDNAGEERIAAN